MSPSPPAETPSRVWTEVLVLYLGTCLTIRALRSAQEGLGLPEDILILVAVLFIKVPDLAERWTGWHLPSEIVQPTPLFPALLRAFSTFLVTIALIYPFFILGNHIWQGWGFTWVTGELLDFRRPYAPHSPRFGLPEDIVEQGIYQLIGVGYAEEWFYRGYMQTRLGTILKGRGIRVFGADLGPAFWVTTILFTLGHSIVTFQWWQPFILFPTLIFGWLRIRTGNVLAGAIFHGFANTAMAALDSIYGVGR